MFDNQPDLNLTYIPERLSWDSKSGVFKDDMGEELPLPMPFTLYQIEPIFAKWGDQIGQPLCQQTGECCGAYENCSQGWQVKLALYTPEGEILGAYILPLFGVASKAASRINNLAVRHGPNLIFNRRREIPTRFGSVFVPVADIPHSSTLAEGNGTQDE